MTPDVLARLAITMLSSMSPTRANWLLTGEEGMDPADVAVAAVDRLKKGLLPVGAQAPEGVGREMLLKWQEELRTQVLDETVAEHAELGIQMLSPADPRWPVADDPEPPALVFYAGDLDLLAHPVAVAVVGTRRCTAVGRTVAYNFGRDLALADVAVVSGLALGVDGAAHRGALDAAGPVIGVVASGIDVIYPGGNRHLWERVKEHGLLLGEAPAKTRPARWRFPARNRLIAGLARGVVVVESHRTGGALLTVDEAIERDRPVYAVPGSVLSAASEGTNALLVEGATPVGSAADVLYDLGVTGFVPEVSPTDEDLASGAAVDAPADLSDHDPDLISLILSEATAGAIHVDRLILMSTSPPGTVLAAVQALVAGGRLDLDGSTVSLR
ncbi:MAG: DNA-processing protein DprA [Actinomycetota bacterium]